MLQAAVHGVVDKQDPLVLPAGEEGDAIPLRRPGQVLLTLEGAVDQVLVAVGEAAGQVAEHLAVLGRDDGDVEVLPAVRHHGDQLA